MIKKIKRIKNLGIFSDYTWIAKLDDFKRYNLIYGWNGCGKTTLSKLFLAFESGYLPSHEDLEYEIDANERSFKQKENFNQKVRVFNEDYILNNVQTLSGKAKPIYILGEENKKIVDQIKLDEGQLDIKQKELKGLIQAKTEATKKKGEKFTQIATTIGLNTGGIASRTYRKPEAEEAFNKLTEKTLLNTDEIKKYSSTLRQHELPSLDLIYVDDKSKELNEIIDEGNKILSKTVKSLVIERLKVNDDISEWVEEGISLHAKHKSKKCEYCTQDLPESRVKELADYFNDEDKKLKDDIEQLVAKLSNILLVVKEVTIKDKMNLYEDLQKEYESAGNNLDTAGESLLKIISESLSYIKNKKSKTTEVVAPQKFIDYDRYLYAIKEVNEIINKHNSKTSDFKSDKENALEKLEKHYLSTIYDEIKELEKQSAIYDESISRVSNGDPKDPSYLSLTALKERISENQNKISSSHKACSEINKNLKTFLGTDEIIFEVEEEGYIIKRLGETATNLSEGEKTTIAFVYFLIHLSDRDFNLKKGIVVIDDPISSLDANILFRVSAFVQTKLVSSEQLFILTHNYDFFNLIKKWFKNELNLGKDITTYRGGFYMIKNYLDSKTKRRCAEISDLDELLRDYESEYHYLFSKLLFYQRDTIEDGRGTIGSIYPYPNLARKFLECFLAFRVPTPGSFLTKFMSLKDFNKDISGTDLSQAYNFVNSHSHLNTKTGLLQFDPTLTLSGEKNIELVLNIVKLADEKHFKDMEKAIKI